VEARRQRPSRKPTRKKKSALAKEGASPAATGNVGKRNSWRAKEKKKDQSWPEPSVVNRREGDC